MKQVFKVQGKTFRKLDDPFLNGESKKYVFYVKASEIPIDIPMNTNPREQKLSSQVAKAIEDSLCSNDRAFHLKNRGIVISAASVTYNNQKEEVTIEYTDENIHGNIDGGHTYKILCEHKEENPDQYVQFEVMTGVDSIIEELARARNTSVQVDEKSMAELANKFEPIKEGLQGMPFYKRIAFKQNQLEVDSLSGKNLKMIDARDIVAIINMFEMEHSDQKMQPTQAYSSKSRMLQVYLDDPARYRRFTNIAPDIFDLFDAIETEFAEAYNSAGGRYGRKKYSGYKDNKIVCRSKFNEQEMIYKVPDGLLYPVVGAFRTLVIYNKTTDKYEWYNGVNPITVWNACKVALVKKVMDFASSIGDNPNAVGKDSNIWDLAYMTVQLQK